MFGLTNINAIQPYFHSTKSNCCTDIFGKFIKFIEEICHGNHFEIKIIEGLTRGSLETVLKIQNDIFAVNTYLIKIKIKTM